MAKVVSLVWLTWAVNLPLMSAMLVANFAIGIAAHAMKVECYFVPERCLPNISWDVPSLGKCRPLDDVSLGQCVPGQCVLILLGCGRGSGYINQGGVVQRCIVQVARHPRNASSKGRVVQEKHRPGDTSFYNDTLYKELYVQEKRFRWTLHPRTHYLSDGTSETFRLGTHQSGTF
jgi:hypothetical protein